MKHLFDKHLAWATAITQEDPEFFSQLSKQQTPEYLWIGCSDSRVPANQIIEMDVLRQTKSWKKSRGAPRVFGYTPLCRGVLNELTVDALPGFPGF